MVVCFHDSVVWTSSIDRVSIRYHADLVDVDWANPDVCYEFVHVLLDSVAHGFTGVRLDAFAYVWKAAETYASALWVHVFNFLCVCVSSLSLS